MNACLDQQQNANHVAKHAMRINSHSNRMAAWLLTGILCMAIIGITGCQQSVSTEQAFSTDEPDQTVRSEIQRGPVTLTVEVSPKNPRLSDEPELTIAIRSQQGVQIEKPPFGDQLGEFLIRDFYEPLPEQDGDGEIIRQIYRLEPTRAGKLTIAPITVQFQDNRTDGDGLEHRIESEPLMVEVSTMLDADAPSLSDLRPAAGPVELPVDKTASWIGLGIVVGLVALGAFVFWYFRRKRVHIEPQLSAQELAWQELQQLRQQNLADSDVKAYYAALTGVVRQYIERSTGVNAPEQTTEEFLREIIDGSVYRSEDQQRLQDFLESADLVKFAGAKPELSMIQSSFDRASEFIQLQRDVSPEPSS